MSSLPKSLTTLKDACLLREQKRLSGKKVVLTNGCFDLLHPGHVHSLRQASLLGDELWVAINSDASIRRMKGNARPLFPELIRAYMLSSLSCVSLIFLFEDDHLTNEILALQPDVYVKSNDYSPESLNPLEKKALEKVGASIEFVSMLEGYSTTGIIDSILLMDHKN